jgi:hypothetical protein
MFFALVFHSTKDSFACSHNTPLFCVQLSLKKYNTKERERGGLGRWITDAAQCQSSYVAGGELVRFTCSIAAASQPRAAWRHVTRSHSEGKESPSKGGVRRTGWTQGCGASGSGLSPLSSAENSSHAAAVLPHTGRLSNRAVHCAHDSAFEDRSKEAALQSGCRASCMLCHSVLCSPFSQQKAPASLSEYDLPSCSLHTSCYENNYAQANR